MVGPKVNPRTRSTTALVASIVLHATVVASVRAAYTEPVPPVEPRDRWSGAATEVEVGVETRGVAAPPAEPQEGTSVAPPPARRLAPKRARPVKPAVDPDAALARKILDYQPASRPAPQSAPAGGAPSAAHDEPSGEKRSLARAFARALPVANTGDPVWDRLPAGDAGSIVVVLSIDEEGKMLDFEQRDRPRAPPYLVRSVERALVLLRAGRFATKDGGGRQAFRLDVTLSDRPAASGPLALGYEAPRTGKSGRSYFQLPSGRFVDVAVSFAGS
jgi:hypothetical protein